MSTGRKRKASWFFWIGVAMSVSCVLVVLARDNRLVSPFEQKDVPVSLAFAGVAALAFLANELCDSLSRTNRADERTTEPARPLPRNGSDKVSKQRFLALMEAEFDRLEKEQSGTLEVQDLNQVLQSRRRAPDVN